MKYSILLFVCLFPFWVGAQDYIQISGKTHAGFTGKDEPVFEVAVNRVDKKTFMDHWETYLKSLGKAKIERTEHQIIIYKAPLKRLEGKVLNIYMYFQPTEKGTLAIVGFQDTVTGFIAADNVQYGYSLRSLLQEETQKVYVKTKAEDIKAEESRQKQLEKEYAAIREKESKLEKEILNTEQQISKLKNDIAVNEDVLDELTGEVSARRSEANSLTRGVPAEVKKNAEKEVKAAEKKRDKLRNQIDKDKKKIFDLEKEVSDIRYEIGNMQPEKEMAAKNLDDQRKLVIALKEEVAKLNR